MFPEEYQRLIELGHLLRSSSGIEGMHEAYSSADTALKAFVKQSLATSIMKLVGKCWSDNGCWSDSDQHQS